LRDPATPVADHDLPGAAGLHLDLPAIPPGVVADRRWAHPRHGSRADLHLQARILPIPVRTSIGRRGGAAGAHLDPRLVLPPPPESEWVIPYANDQRRAHAARRGA